MRDDLAGLDDQALAAALATLAGARLLQVRAEVGHSDRFALKDAGDTAAHDLLLSLLAQARPGDVVLSEEGSGESGRGGVGRLSADRVWIIDPLDGTREFSEAGRGDWAVHVALWERAADELTAGAVGLPVRGITLSAADVEVPAPHAGAPRLVVSRSRPPAVALAAAEALGAELIPMGSAGAKIAAVILGEAEAYVHGGGQYEWDSAAPVAVARAAGLFTSRLDGSPLRYNQPDVRLPDLIVCLPELAKTVLSVTRGRAGEGAL